MAIPPNELFAGIEQQDAPTSMGPCAMPILYRDASLLGAFFRVEPSAAATLLDGTPFEPYVIFGKAVVLLACFEYRDTTVGTYNEVGLAIQAKRRGTSPSLLRFARDMANETSTGLVVTNLPVTTRGARSVAVPAGPGGRIRKYARSDRFLVPACTGSPVMIQDPCGERLPDAHRTPPAARGRGRAC